MSRFSTTISKARHKSVARCAWSCAAALFFVCLPAWAGDPHLRWYTIENERVSVHFHGGLEVQAQRVALVAAALEETLIGWLGRAPRDKTQILISDSSDQANGAANVLPYSAVRLFAAAPDDIDPLSDYDEWMSSLVSHELTHIVHVDNTSGVPALISTILGKQTAPNQLSPRFLIEGMAVLAETRLSSGGRLRASSYEMMLRADVLDGRFATLDQMSGDPWRYPAGTLYYLYGAKFVEYLATLYGTGLFATVISDTSDDVIPYAVSRPFYRATGRTIEELYVGFRRTVEARVAREMDRVASRGLREGRRLTERGRYTSSPRFLPSHCESAKDGSKGTIVFYGDDGHSVSGLYTLSLEGSDQSEHLVTRSSGGALAIAKDCSIYFDSYAPSARRYTFSDLFRKLPNTRALMESESSRRRLTVGRRASHPDISNDGRQIVYVTQRAGTSTLRIADIGDDGTLSNERALVDSAPNEQVYAPRFSHDKTRVAYSAWSPGGNRSIRLITLSSGTVQELFLDRAIERQPSFSLDDKTLFFSSDRTGISNIYAYELETGRLKQVTNVRTGAFAPELSPDQKTLIYVGYTSKGYDLYAIDYSPTQLLEPVEASVVRDDRQALPASGRLAVRDYSPLPTLRPRALSVNYSNDTSGQRLNLSTMGSDIANQHHVAASAVFEPEGNSPDVSVSYDYYRLPFDFGMAAHRISDPNLRYDYGSASSRIVEVRTGGEAAIGYRFSEEFSSQSVGLSYVTESISAELPTGLAADPFGTVPREPRRGITSVLRLGYGFSNASGTEYGSGYERGFTTRLFIEEAHRGLGSELEGTTVTGRVTGYVPMPWARHHVVSLSSNFGATTGQAGTWFALGGYQSGNVLRGALEGAVQSRLTLRGYPSGMFRGSRMLLGQAEYRAPLFMVDRGISTLPVYLRGIHGALAIDAGGAFDSFEQRRASDLFHYGFSAELWFDLVLSYRVTTRLLWGYCMGTGRGAISGGTGYLVVGSAL